MPEEGTKDKALQTILGLSKTLGILEKDAYKELIPEGASKLIKEREAFRKQGNFGEADKIRTELKEKHGISLEDTDYGTIWYRIMPTGSKVA